MKKLFIAVVIIITTIFSMAQNYEIDAYNGQTVNTCSGNFYDSGGPNSSYSPNEDYTVTFCSNNPDSTHIIITFPEGNNGVVGSDTIYFFDGPNANSPLLGSYNNSTNPPLDLISVEATINNTSGCITVVFHSDGSGQDWGWVAFIGCFRICQQVFAHIDTLNTLPNPDTNYIAICLGDEITFAGYGEYPQNDMVYHQDDASSLFIWDFGDGNSDTGQVVTHIYDSIWGYNVSLTIYDTNGCISTNTIGTRVMISGNPFTATYPPVSVCAHDTTQIIFSVTNSNANVQGGPYTHQINTTLAVTDTLYLPDIETTGQCYQTSVNFNSFAPGQMLQQASDILGVCAMMEHSWMGDLEISLICPNGNSVILEQYTGGTGENAGVYLGEAINIDSPDPQYMGTGYEYCWTMINPDYGTMAQKSYNVSSGTPMPSGSYTPYEPLSNLVGCPLNGLWTFQVCDYWTIDDGWIFGWELQLDPSLVPNSWEYTADFADIGWTSGPFIIQQNDSVITVCPDSGGTFIIPIL